MRFRPTGAAWLFVVSTLPAVAQQPAAETGDGLSAPVAVEQTSAQDSAQVEELRRRVDVLAAELEQLRSGETPQIELTDERRRALGLAPSAAATYRRASGGVSFAGYGEMLLENFTNENESGAGRAPTPPLELLRAGL